MQPFPVQFSFLLPGRWQLSAYSQVQHLWIFSYRKQQIKYFSIRKQIHLGRASSSASSQARQRDQLSELLHYEPQIMLQARYELGLGKLQEAQADFRSLCANVIKTTHTWWENNTQHISESSIYRIREWFGLEEALQIIQLQTICQDIQPMASKPFRAGKDSKDSKVLGMGVGKSSCYFFPGHLTPSHTCALQSTMQSCSLKSLEQTMGMGHGHTAVEEVRPPSHLQSC